MGLQDQIPVFYSAPATRKSGACFQEVDGPVQFTTPWTCHDPFAPLVNLYDGSWRDQRIHHSVLCANVTISVTGSG